ncbi:tyrosine-type recombinase/integrase [Leisingera caerulea]|uniref:tyrosine-type recombinase/integrase n=1 Tax=Leisingera caerulea TaxID=506591 RepID=UPI0021A64980|nr:site-specific integrase [Leisingera caerulea]
MTNIDDSTKNMLATIAAQHGASQGAQQAAQPFSFAATPVQNHTPTATQKKAEPSPAKASKKKGTKEPKVEPYIAERVTSGGRKTYRVQIRRRVDGKQHSLCKTFRHLKNAKEWRDKKLAVIELHGFPIKVLTEKTIADVIADRLKRGRELGRSAKQNLEFIKKHEFGKIRVSTLTQQQLYEFAEELLNEERTSQTVAGYMTHLASALKWAQRRETLIPIEVVTLAMETLWEDEILARSEERERRPELGELDKILSSIASNRRQKLPVAVLLVFAIFSARRLSEICRLRWDDLREASCKILVRDMKHPRRKKGNDVWCALSKEALAIILAMPRTSEYIFPFNAKSVGTAYRRHRDKVGVEGLRFHDFRHEAISRLFEMGKPAAFVSKISGHKNGGCLYRYEHVEESGDKFADWPWFERVLEMCACLPEDNESEK